MNKRIKHSYKLKDDTLESLCEQLIDSRISSARLRRQLEELQQQLIKVQNSLAQVSEQVAENERKVIYIMQTKHKKKCVVNRISFELVDNELKISLVLD